MLSEEQIEEIREHLARAQNPIFFFDNDCDGLMGFILLRRYIGRGKGVAIKSFPELDATYSRKLDEFSADYIFVLDKPAISEDFMNEAKQRNLPIVWIDHHDIGIKQNKEGIYYFNPCFSEKKSCEPVSYISYRISGRKQDMWLAIAGCIADNFMPDFAPEIVMNYPEIWKKNSKTPFEVLYETEFGKLILMLDFSLKDRTTNVVSMINLLFMINSPFEILKEDEKNFRIHRRYEQVGNVYSKLLEKAKRIARKTGRIVFFQYGGELSLSSDIANELSYRFPGKLIIIAYIKGSVANVSVRGGIDVRDLTIRAINEIGNATGGGHKFATGAKMNIEDLDKFRKFFEKNINKFQ